jgi:hypothetical protein
MGEEDADADDRFPPQMTCGETALMTFVLVVAAVAIGLVAGKLFYRP